MSDEYMALIHEWNDSIHSTDTWGKDTDTDYHDKGILDDKDYRDGTTGTALMWQDDKWKAKRHA